MESPAASAKSAVGTCLPSICTCDCPNWMRAMSLMAGCFIQPDRLTTAVTSMGAPHRGHDVPDGSLGCRQYRHTYPVSAMVIGSLACGVVLVHRLDADPARTGHLGQVHRPPER